MLRLPPRLGVELLEARTVPSTVDPTFGTDGLVNLGPGGDAKVADLPNGQTLVLIHQNGWFVERLNADGAPDTTFGTGGRATLPSAPAPLSTTYDGLAGTPDGGVVVVGASGGLPNDATTHPAIVKLTPGGQPDARFDANTAGIAGYGPDASGSADAAGVAVAPDGVIVVAGTGYGSSRALLTAQPLNPARAGLLRLLPDGTLDTTFNGSGEFSFGSESGFDLGSADSSAVSVSAAGLAVDPDGRVVVVGTVTGPVGGQPFAARVASDGHLDPAFNGTGIAELAFPATVGFPPGQTAGWWVGIGPNGEIIVGMTDTAFPSTHPDYPVVEFAVTRLTDAGAVDPAYGTAGAVTVTTYDQITTIEDMTIAPDGSVAAIVSDLTPGGFVVEPNFVEEIYCVSAAGRVAILGGLVGIGGSLLHSVTGVSISVDPVGRLTVVDQDDGNLVVGRLTDLGDTSPPTVPPPPAPPTVPPAPSPAPPIIPAPSRPFPSSFKTPAGATLVTADVNGDGTLDGILVEGNTVRVVNGEDESTLVAPFTPFPGFTGGLSVVAVDLNNDGAADLIVTPGTGGGVVVVVYDGTRLAAGGDPETAQIGRFLGIDDPNFRGGARVVAGDINGDGTPDLVVAAGPGGGPRVAVYDGRSVASGGPKKLVNDFFAFDPELRSGVYVAVGNVDGDRFGDLAIGAGPGGGPRVTVLSGQTLSTGGAAAALAAPIADYFAGDSSARSGAPVSVPSDGRVVVTPPPGTNGQPDEFLFSVAPRSGD